LVGLSGSKSLVRGYLDARAYRGFGPDERVVLAGRLQFGAIAGAQVADTPPDLLFLSGGSGTVRGHDYQSLSIPLGTGRSGGRSFLGVAGELRVDVTSAISAVAFYDAGYIGASSLPDGTGIWHSGAGLGLRYQTGIGPIRLDLAVPVTGASANNLQFYVGIGQAF
jgi:translocation and assembly module TamA